MQGSSQRNEKRQVSGFSQDNSISEGMRLYTVRNYQSDIEALLTQTRLYLMWSALPA
jgi:hypothetical protein